MQYPYLQLVNFKFKFALLNIIDESTLSYTNLFNSAHYIFLFLQKFREFVEKYPILLKKKQANEALCTDSKKPC